VLRHRFGADERIPALARTLLARDVQNAVAAALDASSLDELAG
jgi:hypothetical protein